MLDFGKLGGSAPGGGIIEPRKIFTTLVRHARFRRPSDEQGEVLDKWFAERNRQDNTLKMNTGSGKTLVGLLMLQSSLNESVAPAVYITPDNYLLAQTLAEARDLGIAVTDNEHSADFLSGKSILVANVWKLINGRSAFGVGSDGRKIPIGALVIDDAHACLATVEDQFCIEVSADHKIYAALLELFADDLAQQSEVGFLDVKAQDPRSLMAVPFWAWKDKQDRVLRILHDARNDDVIKFPWPLLKDVLHLCRCAFGGGKLEIAPRCLPIDQIPSFVQAKRRIYMTATLADDGVLVTRLNANPVSISAPIKPKGAGEIGDRMILAPQEINPEITVENVKGFAAELARSYNVVVIVPSHKRSEFWRDIATQILDKNNITQGVAQLKARHVGLTVLINKYDGIDLPEDACRVLIIDGLPEVYGLIDRLEMSALDGTEFQLIRQVQKLEQGMGRGVRSGEDHCVVLLMGARLTHHIHHPGARNKFTPATLAQLDLGREVTEQVRGKPIGELRPLLDYCLRRDPNWWRAGRERLANAPEGRASFIDPAVQHVRAGFDAAQARRFDIAQASLQAAVNGTQERPVAGYLRQQLAEYVQHINPAQAQEILLAGLKDNPRILKPLAGITYSKLSSPAAGQAAAAANYIGRFLEGNDLIIFMQSLLEDLDWNPDRTNRFEAAVRDLGLFLGFGSQRPEEEIGKGPDNLWALGGLQFMVIECKSGVTGNLISKSDCNQLIGSMSWFKKAYDDTCKGVPVLIHPVNRFDRYSSPTGDMRIVEKSCFVDLKKALRGYATALAAQPRSSEEKVYEQLDHFNLTADKFLRAFSVNFSVDR